MRILLVEDNPRISEFVIRGLEENDHSVVLAENGIDARELITRKEWEIILLDIMLPGIDGLELVQYTRRKKINTPILVISALSETDDKIKALDYGADDYLTKPFLFRELIAYINALTRRAKLNYDENRDILECEDLTLDIDKHKIERAGEEIKLTLQEFKLLKTLLENKNRVVTRTQLLDNVWGVYCDNTTNVVDVYISYLRNKIDAGHPVKLIKTIKGRGYLIQSQNTPKVKAK